MEKRPSGFGTFGTCQVWGRCPEHHYHHRFYIDVQSSMWTNIKHELESWLLFGNSNLCMTYVKTSKTNIHRYHGSLNLFFHLWSYEPRKHWYKCPRNRGVETSFSASPWRLILESPDLHLPKIGVLNDWKRMNKKSSTSKVNSTYREWNFTPVKLFLKIYKAIYGDPKTPLVTWGSK